MNEVLRAVGLTVAASTPVGTVFIKGISGGQQRRLSLACEMLVNPSLIFLDEPTSGAAPSRVAHPLCSRALPQRCQRCQLSRCTA